MSSINKLISQENNITKLWTLTTLQILHQNHSTFYELTLKPSDKPDFLLMSSCRGFYCLDKLRVRGKVEFSLHERYPNQILHAHHTRSVILCRSIGANDLQRVKFRRIREKGFGENIRSSVNGTRRIPQTMIQWADNYEKYRDIGRVHWIRREMHCGKG